MSEFFYEKVMDAFSSMKTTDSISLDDMSRLIKLEKYYVDPFNYISNIMQDEDNFIIGRRGAGKSTLLYRAYIECLNTWDETKKVYKPRILPLFIDLSQCTIIAENTNTDIAFEEYFTSELLRNFRKYIYQFWGQIIPCDGEHEESTLLDDLSFYLDDVEQLIKSGKPILVTSTETEQKIKNNSETKDEFKLDLKSFSLSSHNIDGTNVETTQKMVVKSNYTLGEFLDRLGEIRKTANISSIYVFVDEYSELSTEQQIKLATLLKKLAGSRKGIYFKVVAITDNYSLGPIRLQRDFYEISLDFHKFVERSSSLNNAFDNLEKFTQKIITQRLEAYACGISLDKLFSHKNAIALISKASMAIPRTIGIILKEAWNQATAAGRKYMTLDDLNFGINSAGDAYYSFFKGNVGLAIPKFYDDLWKELTNRAREERKVNSKKAACFFLISDFRDNHFKFLTENYLLHLIKKGTETTVKGETAKSLYMIDYAFIEKFNLGFNLERDTIRQQRFLYDSLLKKYDHFFAETRKSYKCPNCGEEYTEQQLFIPGMNTTLNFCLKCKTNLEKIEGLEYKAFTFTEEERKILGAIGNRNRDNAILARDVAEIVGCSKHKVANLVEKIIDRKIVGREKLNGQKNPYSYFKLEDMF